MSRNGASKNSSSFYLFLPSLSSFPFLPCPTILPLVPFLFLFRHFCFFHLFFTLSSLVDDGITIAPEQNLGEPMTVGHP